MSAAAYLAGIVDGEGSIYLKVETRGAEPVVTLSIHNTSEALMAWLTQATGRVPHPGRAACPQNCDCEHVHRRKRVMEWRERGEAAAILLRNMLPFLVVKREAAINALAAWASRPVRTQANMERTRRRLAELGWQTPDPGPEHGLHRQYRAGCRCTLCRGANAKRVRETRR